MPADLPHFNCRPGYGPLICGHQKYPGEDRVSYKPANTAAIPGSPVRTTGRMLLALQSQPSYRSPNELPAQCGDTCAAEVCWLDDPSPIGAFFAEWSGQVPAGWHRLLERTLLKLLAVNDGSDNRRRALAGMRVVCTDEHLWMMYTLGSHPDAVLRGIVRKANDLSWSTCRDCGRAARLRRLAGDATATLCARCAAPWLLQHDIWQLEQSLRFLKAVNVYVVPGQVPQLLRRSFLRHAAEDPEDFGAGGKIRMRPQRFVAWAQNWKIIGERIAHPCNSNEVYGPGV